ncbi:DUF397 domain-containing protein [Streptomyces acidiscabies]|uniref:DUF397 domain-containing protein n=1 Tax=Streptomyces acidiscabies TaxID=42234 RepID=UPI00099B3233|nr:DUF397 domain-containing protein [Streptomyces acidiscabies]
MPDRTWRKSSYSDNTGGNCLEVLDGHPTSVPVRDSKTPHAPSLLIPASAWTPFIAAVRTSPLHP